MTKSSIHKSAIIEEGAIIGDDCFIGPFSYIGENVKIGNGTICQSHVVIKGHTDIGENNEIYPFASLGQKPQDLKYKGEKSSLEIGHDNSIREYVTMHTGTQGGSLKTVVGHSCLFMIGCHIAHDCMVGNHVIMANNGAIAGHVTLGDFVILGAGSGVHQFVSIGKHSIVGAMAAIDKDIPPFCTAVGERSYLRGINIEGLKRRNFSKKDIVEIQGVFRDLFVAEKEGSTKEKAQEILLSDKANNPYIVDFVNFIINPSKRGLSSYKTSHQ